MARDNDSKKRIPLSTLLANVLASSAATGAYTDIGEEPREGTEPSTPKRSPAIDDRFDHSDRGTDPEAQTESPYLVSEGVEPETIEPEDLHIRLRDLESIENSPYEADASRFLTERELAAERSRPFCHEVRSPRAIALAAAAGGGMPPIFFDGAEPIIPEGEEPRSDLERSALGEEPLEFDFTAYPVESHGMQVRDLPSHLERYAGGLRILPGYGCVDPRGAHDRSRTSVCLRAGVPVIRDQLTEGDREILGSYPQEPIEVDYGAAMRRYRHLGVGEQTEFVEPYRGPGDERHSQILIVLPKKRRTNE